MLLHIAQDRLLGLFGKISVESLEVKRSKRRQEIGKGRPQFLDIVDDVEIGAECGDPKDLMSGAFGMGDESCRWIQQAMPIGAMSEWTVR